MLRCAYIVCVCVRARMHVYVYVYFSWPLAYFELHHELFQGASRNELYCGSLYLGECFFFEHLGRLLDLYNTIWRLNLLPLFCEVDCLFRFVLVYSMLHRKRSKKIRPN